MLDPAITPRYTMPDTPLGVVTAEHAVRPCTGNSAPATVAMFGPTCAELALGISEFH